VRCIVNAAGPWVLQFLQSAAHHSASRAVRLIKGSHIVVRSLFEHSHAYIFQHPDKRIVFAIPYEKEFTLIGTTDIEYRGDAGQVAIDEAEIAYLCELSNHYFSKTITPADVVWSYSGVRPLVDDEHADASAVTRDYRFEYHGEGAPLLSIFGGKITTFRKLAEEAVDLISPALGNHCGPWTRDACLPGGDVFATHPENRAVREFGRFQSQLQADYPWLPASLALRYSRAYGTRTRALLHDCKGMADLGQEIVPGLYAREAAYLVEHEWAQSAEDILWRRTKLGLHSPAGGDKRLDDWLAACRMKKEAAA
jgi:glycerol-3-phosphate dehydrogenase